MADDSGACPKGMLNGPCGGVHDGECEVGGECAWVRAFNALKKAGKLDQFLKINLPKR